MKYLVVKTGILFALLFAGRLLAHNAQPCYLELQAGHNGEWLVTWKNLITDRSGVPLSPRIGKTPLAVVPQKEFVSGNYLIRQWTIVPATPLWEQVISIDGLQRSALPVIVQLIDSSGQRTTQLLTAQQPSFTIAQHQAYSTGSYFWLGITHIWRGIDHLLFVLGLLLLVRSKRTLLQTITAFTIAHSITLALSALGWVKVPAAPVEAVIALSIVFLALELVRHESGVNRLTSAYPWLVAFIFGLLHGFGFAGALGEIGLPADDVVMALLLFNAGVEAGQIAFVAVVLCIGWLFDRQLHKAPRWVRLVPPYAIGSMAAFWLIERTVSLFS